MVTGGDGTTKIAAAVGNEEAQAKQHHTTKTTQGTSSTSLGLWVSFYVTHFIFWC
jgi:hypothetical protein